MSAFVVSHDHINKILDFVREHGHAGEMVLAMMAKDLLAWNLQSYNHRYKEDQELAAEWDRFRIKPGPAPAPIEAVKLLDCLEYQCCERDDYEQHPGFQYYKRAYALAMEQIPVNPAILKDTPAWQEAAWSI